MRLTAAVGPWSAWPAQAGRSLYALWHREFHDVRIIVEQQGELHYFSIKRQFQRAVVRSLMVASLAAVAIVTALSALAVYLHLQKSQLERSHQEIFMALVGSTDGAEGMDRDAVQAEMLTLAQTIRERDMEIRRYVDSATTDIQAQNDSLRSRLESSGLTEKAIKVIHSSTPMGGFAPSRDQQIDPLLRKEFAEHSAANRELRDVLSALPSQLPLRNHQLTSSFGIRKHPVHGVPRLHAGIDLISDLSDNVFPAKAGRVVLARPYNDYGNTVIVSHGRGVETLYAHLASIKVREGQEVDLDTVLGLVGNTGTSTGKHLHFEVSVGGYPVDPLKVINTAQYVQQAKNQ